MRRLTLESVREFTGTSEELMTIFDNIIESNQNPTTFFNTEGALTWIIRGSIEYFDKLSPNFLGDGNGSGIPSMQADYFANNLYRLVNAIDYLSGLWNIENSKSEKIVSGKIKVQLIAGINP